MADGGDLLYKCFNFLQFPNTSEHVLDVSDAHTETCTSKGQRQTERERERGGGEREIKLYFSTVKILALRPTYISVVATHYC